MRLAISLCVLLAGLPQAIAAAAGAQEITVRAEQYPRPPYSGATYSIYERDGVAICTQLEVCNKFDECSVTHHPGSYRDPEDEETGEPYASSPPVPIAPAELDQHACLARHPPGAS